MLMIGTNNTGANTAPEIAEGVGAVVLEMRHGLSRTRRSCCSRSSRAACPAIPCATRSPRSTGSSRSSTISSTSSTWTSARSSWTTRACSCPTRSGRQPAPAGQGLRHLGRGGSSPAGATAEVRSAHLAGIRQGRSDRDSSPCPTPPRSRARTPAASRHRRRLPRSLGAGSSNRRRGRPGCRST